MLLDTSGLFCLFDRADVQHREAMELIKTAPSRLVHSYILAELVALFHARRMNRATALEFVGDLQDSEIIEVAWVDEVMHRSAMTLLLQRMDKSYSLCDAVSFLLMREKKEQRR